MNLVEQIKQKKNELGQLESQLMEILKGYREEQNDFMDGTYRNGDKYCLVTQDYNGIQIQFFPYEPIDEEDYNFPIPTNEDWWMLEVVNHLNIDV